MNKKLLLYLVMNVLINYTFAQPNCYAYLYNGDTSLYEACKASEKIEGIYQFNHKFHEILDSSLQIDSTFAFAYKEKSVAYLKSGDFINFKKWIDLAVKYDPISNLGYRAWCRYQFYSDYEGAIRDINQLDSLVDTDIAYGANGEFHLNFTKALCYHALKKKKRALSIALKQLKQPNYSNSTYDYQFIGLLYLQLGDLINAKNYLLKQQEYFNHAETQYYLSKVDELENKRQQRITHLENAVALYKKGILMFDPYTTYPFKIYHQDILDELNNAQTLPNNQ